jgi:hypothetical protein
MSNCTKTHELQITRLGSSVTRNWIRLSDGAIETDAATLLSLEATVDGSAGCNSPEPIQAVQLSDTCVTVDGLNPQYATPVPLFNQISGVFIGKVWLDAVGDEITGVVAKTDPCDCECVDCGVEACILMDGFDVDRGLFDPGDTTSFVIRVDGVVQATVVHDYTTTSDGVNVSSFYAPVIAAINALPDWSIAVQTDVAIADQGKVEWIVNSTATAAQTLEIIKFVTGTTPPPGADTLTLVADGAGAITGTSTFDGNGSDPFRACP